MRRLEKSYLHQSGLSRRSRLQGEAVWWSLLGYPLPLTHSAVRKSRSLREALQYIEFLIETFIVFASGRWENLKKPLGDIDPLAAYALDAQSRVHAQMEYGLASTKDWGNHAPFLEGNTELSHHAIITQESTTLGKMPSVQ